MFRSLLHFPWTISDEEPEEEMPVLQWCASDIKAYEPTVFNDFIIQTFVLDKRRNLTVVSLSKKWVAIT